MPEGLANHGGCRRYLRGRLRAGQPRSFDVIARHARVLADARAGKLHPSLLTVLMADAYGKPRDTTTSEPMIPSSEIEEARQSLQVKLQIAEGPIPLQIDDIRRVCLMVEPMSVG